MNEDILTESRKRLEGDDTYFNLLFNSFEGESERSIGIISICILDEQLEKLIRSYFIKDPQVSALFKSDHILQTFYAKINIAYFAGLISKCIYDDLKVLGKIRNKFAHEVISNARFSDPVILKLINQCKTRLKILDGILSNPNSRTLAEMAKLQYVMITSRVGTYLSVYDEILVKSRLTKLTEIFKIDEAEVDKTALNKSEFLSLISKNAAKQ